MANQSAHRLNSSTMTAIMGGISACCLSLTILVGPAAAAQRVQLPPNPCSGVSPTYYVNWSQYRFVPCQTGSNPYEFALSPATIGTIGLLWSYQTGSLVDSSPAVVNGVVYIGSNDNNMYALDARTGNLLWKASHPYGEFSSPAVANGLVYYAAGDYNIYALYAATGRVKWKYPTSFFSFSSPTVVDGVVYIGSGYTDNNIYALDANTGKLKWKYTTGSDVPSSPAVANGVVYAFSDDNYLYALHARSGKLLWKRLIKGGTSSPAVAKGVVYVGSADGTLYALDASTGAVLWKYPTYGGFNSSPAVGNGMVFIGNADYSVYAFDASNGALVWTYSTNANIAFSSAAFANGVVYIGSDDANLYALDAKTGALLWNYTTGSVIQSSPAVANGVVYVGSEDRSVYAFSGCNHGVNLVTNGSFETGDFTGWTLGGNFYDASVVSGPKYRYKGAESGQYYAALQAVGSPGDFGQDVIDTPGDRYTFCFWLAAVGDSPSNFTASWDNNPVYSKNNPNTDGVWTLYTFSVTGTGFDTINFSFGDDPGWIALDSVSVF